MWEVAYPYPDDSTIVQVKGLYTGIGKILYNNEKGTNIGANSEDIRLDMPVPTAAQIIEAEKVVFAKKITDLFQPGERRSLLTTKEDSLWAINKSKSFCRIYMTIVSTNGDTSLVVNLVDRPAEEIEKTDGYYYFLQNYSTYPFLEAPYFTGIYSVDLKTKLIYIPYFLPNFFEEVLSPKIPQKAE